MNTNNRKLTRVERIERAVAILQDRYPEIDSFAIRAAIKYDKFVSLCASGDFGFTDPKYTAEAIYDAILAV